jgi:hypothetical protein
MALAARSSSTRIDFEATPDVRAGLDALGRTEDVRFAPSGRRLAIACFATGRIAVADVEVATSAAGPRVAVTRLDQFSSPLLREPHGLDFVDEETLVVGNRSGGIAVFRVPAGGATAAPLEPLGPVVEQASDGPGSVLVDSPDPGRREVLACNNWADTVTRHVLEPGWTLRAGEVVLHKWLDLPDGLALSHDGRWLATSNHNSHSVLVHDYPPRGADADPVAVLRGVLYPHGIRFSADDSYLAVADAGSPHVHVFASVGAGWRGAGYPAAILRVMDDETFARGRHNPEEGGPKGIDLHPSANVLAVTAECLPLAFFDVDAALEQPRQPEVDDLLLHYELGRRAEIDAIKGAAAHERAQLAADREQIESLHANVESLNATVDQLLRERSELRDSYESSRSWRATKPLRAATAGLRRLRQR